MEKEFVPYELAVKLKALGFDEPCFGRWLIITEWEKPTGEVRLQIGSKVEDYSKNQFTAPLYQQAFRWFREKYDFYVVIKPFNSEFSCIIWTSKGQYHIGVFLSYEEAELACLEKLIEIVESKSE